MVGVISQYAKSGFNTKKYSTHKMPVCQAMNQQKLPAMAFATNQKSLAHLLAALVQWAP